MTGESGENFSRKLGQDIEIYRDQVDRFLAKDLSADMFQLKRVLYGVYEQREDDTYMIRVRVPAGTLDGPQVRTLAVMSRKYANGTLHITTRQDVQLHDVKIRNTPAIMRELSKVGLFTKGAGGNTVRNICTCPYAGICPCERFDVTICAHAIAQYFLTLPASYNLPRKYKIALSGCASDCAFAQVADLGFIAEVEDGQAGFRVFVGGGMGRHSRVADVLTDWIPARDILWAAEVVRRLFDEWGDRTRRQRARLRFAVEKMGIGTFRLHFHQTGKEARDQGLPYGPEDLSWNVNSFRAGLAPPRFEKVKGAYVLRQRQENFMAVPIHLPLGMISAHDLDGLGDLASEFSEEKGIRLTRRQNLFIRFISRERLEEFTGKVRDLNESLLRASALRSFVVCTGASTCRIGLCSVREVARASADSLEKSGIAQETVEDFEVHMNGCPNACAHQPIAALGFAGKLQKIGGNIEPLYEVSVAGRCDSQKVRMGLPLGQIPAKAVPGFVIQIARDFEEHRLEGELFHDYMDRMDLTWVKDKIREANLISEDEGVSRDFGKGEISSLPGQDAKSLRGSGCKGWIPQNGGC